MMPSDVVIACVDRFKETGFLEPQIHKHVIRRLRPARLETPNRARKELEHGIGMVLALHFDFDDEIARLDSRDEFEMGLLECLSFVERSAVLRIVAPIAAANKHFGGGRS